MIEDVQTNRTYFLKRGQELKGVKVQSISKEKVVVTLETLQESIPLDMSWL
jgi:hypothetical protein